MTRITGINSGLDIDALVKASLTSYQNKVDTETQNKKVLEYQQEQYKQIMSDASNFYDKYFDVLKTGSLVSSSTYQTQIYSSSDNGKVIAKGLAGAKLDNYIVSVEQLASKATDELKLSSASGTQKIKIGTAEITFELGSDGSKTVLNYNEAIAKKKEELNGKATLTNEEKTELADLNNNIINATYSDFTNSIVFTASAFGSTGFTINENSQANDKYLRATITNSNGDKYEIPDKKIDNVVTVDNVQFTFKAVTSSTSQTEKHITTSSITSIFGDDITKIAESTSKEYTLSDSSKITITDDGIVSIIDASGKVLDTSGLMTLKIDGGITIKGDGTFTTNADPNTTKYITSESINSIFNNYITKVSESTSKEYTLTDGSKINIADDGTIVIHKYDKDKKQSTILNGTDTLDFTTSDGTKMSIKADGSLTTSVDTTIKLTGTTDFTSLKDTIVKFVDDYNTLISSINTKIYEIRDKDYMPLTDEQKEAMTESQITSWEKKAQTGLLRKDSDLERIISEMKSAVSTVISGSGLSFEKIGISPVKDYTSKNGMLTVDENKLTIALEENAGGVKDLFMRSSTSTYSGGALIQLKSTLYNEFKTSSSLLSKKAGLTGSSTENDNTLTDNIYKKKLLISDLKDKFTEKETALYKKYSALETALETLSAQQSSLASMLGTT